MIKRLNKSKNRNPNFRRSMLVEPCEPRICMTADDSLFLQGRWSSTALDGNTGRNGTPVRLTWSFVPDGTLIPPSQFDNPPGLTLPSNLGASMNAFGGGVQSWFDRMDAALNNWEYYTGLSFTPVFDDGAAWGSPGLAASPGVIGRGDVRIAARYIDGAQNTLAYNSAPNNGDMVIDSNEMSIVPQGAFWEVQTNARPFRNTFAHEIGHGIGLTHVMPEDNTKLMEPHLSTSFEGPQFHEIRLMQGYYGDPFEKTGADLRGRNDTIATANAYGLLPGGLFPLSSWSLGVPRSIADTNDKDFLSFQIGPGRKDLSIAAVPYGAVYSRGVQGGAAPTAFDPQAMGNLRLALFNSAGQQVASADSSGTGSAELLSIRRLDPGTYYVRVDISSGSLQTYDLATNVADYVPAAPSAPDLAASSDSGASDTDNVTNDNTPTVTGTAEFPGQRVDLYDFIVPSAPVFLGSGFVDAAGNWSVTSIPLADGPHFLYAAAVDDAVNSTFSPLLAITTDTVAPAAPTGLRIRADFDSGVSNSDNITNFNQPRFAFNLPELGYETRISAGLQFITLTSTGLQDVQFSQPFADDSYPVTVYARDLAGNTSSQLIPILIDTTRPTISSFAFHRTTSQEMQVNFSEPLSLTSQGLLRITPTEGGPAYDFTQTQTVGNSILYRPGVLLQADGQFNANLPGLSASDTAGNVPQINSPAFSFGFMRADFNLDGSVNIGDFATLASHFNLPGTNAHGDADYNGTVNIGDFSILASTFNRSLAGSARSAAATTRSLSPFATGRAIDELLHEISVIV